MESTGYGNRYLRFKEQTLQFFKCKINKNLERKILIVFLIALIISLIVFNCLVLPYKDFFSENSSFYFLSSLLQANASILSISGVFFIFRIQSLQSSIDIIKSSLMSDRGNISWPGDIVKFDNLLLNDKESYLKSEQKNKYILQSLIDWTSKEKLIHNIKKEIIIPTILIGTGIIVESICLFSANYVHVYFNLVEYYILFVNLLLELAIVFFVIKSILKSLN